MESMILLGLIILIQIGLGILEVIFGGLILIIWLKLHHLDSYDRVMAEWWLLTRDEANYYSMYESLYQGSKTHIHHHYHHEYPRSNYDMITSETILAEEANKPSNNFEGLQKLLKSITVAKKGLEIGGPSPLGTDIYENVASIDNVIFSKETVWSQQTEMIFSKIIINDATKIIDISNDTYDFVFASHTLQHIANPLKALNEWLRVLHSDGHLILVLPEKTETFDHKREISPLKTLISQYERNVGEDDLSSLGEILRFHDLSRDLKAGNLEEFTKRSLNNYENRCLHHYVYNSHLLKEICNYLKCKFIFTFTSGVNIWFIMKK